MTSSTLQIQHLVGPRLYSIARALYGYLKALSYIGWSVQCPCCTWRFRHFAPAQRPDALCPRCGSLERHRLLWLYLKNKTNLFDDHLRVLHFAPEPSLQNSLARMPRLHYVSVDLMSSNAMARMDITNIAFDNNVFDVILCSHVLEHIVDDHIAMRELFRVLKPNGWAILQSPIDLSRDVTFEDFKIVSPHEREALFGQDDHVRIYGRDYRERLIAAGFVVDIDQYVRELDTDTIRKYRLMEDEDLYCCRKIAQPEM